MSCMRECGHVYIVSVSKVSSHCGAYETEFQQFSLISCPPQPLSAATQSLPPPSHTTLLDGSSVPNGPLTSLGVREEAELIDVNGSPPPSLAVVEDPLLHLGRTGAGSAHNTCKLAVSPPLQTSSCVCSAPKMC